MPAWVQTLSKEQVAQILAQYNLDNTGNLDVLRRRFRQFASQRPELFPSSSNNGNTMPKMDDEEPMGAPPLSLLERTKVLNQIRKWDHQFEGKDPLSFLERIDELRWRYGYEDKQLLLGLPELLKGDALLWYRNHRDSWATWEDFCRGLKARFLSADFNRKTRQEILGRYQKQGEAFTSYSTALLTMMRRAGGYSEADQLDQIYENLDPELQLHIRREEVKTFDDLSSRVAHIEAIQRRRKDRQGEVPTAKGTVAAATYSREECCWRCK